MTNYLHMDKENWHKYLVSYDNACNQSLKNIQDLRSGKVKFINSGFNVLNGTFFNGLQTNRIMVIAALSSVGKTTYVSQLRKNILALNDNIKWLSFNFEMIASDIIDNEIVSELNVDLKTLYSVNEKITDTILTDINNKVFSKKKPIDFVDIPLDYKMIGKIIYEYWKEYCKPSNTILMYDIDHALIVNGMENDTETKKVENLMKILNVVKKRIASEGGHFIGIILSQIKRDLEDKSRISDRIQHYPRKSDMAYSQALEHYADVIMVLHAPNKLNLTSYGSSNYPIYVYENNKLRPIIYLHILKARRVQPDKVLILIPELEHFKFRELPSEIFSNALKNIQKNSAGSTVITI